LITTSFSPLPLAAPFFASETAAEDVDISRIIAAGKPSTGASRGLAAATAGEVAVAAKRRGTAWRRRTDPAIREPITRVGRLP
jgi:hypothetical protein